MSKITSFFHNEKVLYILAFIAYFTTVLLSANKFDSFLLRLLRVIGVCAFIPEFVDLMLLNLLSNPLTKIPEELKKCIKEIGIYIPLNAAFNFLMGFIINGNPTNQESLEEMFLDTPIIIWILLIVIIGPMTEEFSFRFLPLKIIKSKYLYILGTSFIFAALHVANDLNAVYYLWAYMFDAIYFGYRYYETNDIWVPISLHCFNNLLGTIELIILFYIL